MTKTTSHILLATLFSFAIVALTSSAQTKKRTSLEQLQAVELETLAQGKASQIKIDRLDDKTAALAADYRVTLEQIESIKKYNSQMNRLIAAQKKEKVSLQKQIKTAGTIDRHISPLMHRMLEGLDKFIALDSPFLLAERKKRIASLNTLMDSAKASPAEKFRKLLDAYAIEMTYGRTLETWQGKVGRDERSVNFIRFGRLAWVYQTFDKSKTALWDKENKQWQEIYGWSDDIYKAIKVAREQAPPALLLIPVQGTPVRGKPVRGEEK